MNKYRVAYKAREDYWTAMVFKDGDWDTLFVCGERETAEDACRRHARGDWDKVYDVDVREERLNEE